MIKGDRLGAEKLVWWESGYWIQKSFREGFLHKQSKLELWEHLRTWSPTGQVEEWVVLQGVTGLCQGESSQSLATQGRWFGFIL